MPRVTGWSRPISLCLALLSAVIALAVLKLRPQAIAKPRISRRAALEVLRSEHLAFLVTHRVTTNVLVEKRVNHPLLGKREGVLIATVRILYGVGLTSLPPDAVQRHADALVVTLPKPRELDFGVDMSSIRFISKRSGLMVLRDLLTGADPQEHLRAEFHRAARRFMRREGLLPARRQLVRRLNGFAPALSRSLGARVVFR